MAIPFSYNIRNLWTRRLTTGLTLSGMALVVFVFASILMLAEGTAFRRLFCLFRCYFGLSFMR